MIETEKRTVQVKFRLSSCACWFPVAFAFSTRRIGREGDEAWTVTAAGQKEMGRKNGDAVRIMLQERQQENCGDREHLD
jgi:hypothetical protein